ncbi:hypothetical protein BGW42_007978, partial [Actinomortierella wolfii]
MLSQQARMATQYIANFPRAEPGQYALYLKIKQHSNEETTAGPIDQIPVELAISNTGDKVAIYQVPKTGDWLEEKPKMDVFLFRNRLADDSFEDKNSLIRIETPPALKDII